MIGGALGNNNYNNQHPEVKGMSYPTQQGQQGTPRDAAMARQNDSADKANKLNNIVKGGASTRGGAINVPQYQMPYQPTNGSESHPNNQITNNAKTSTQGAENAKYDHYATHVPKNGGSRRGRKKQVRKSIRKSKTRKTRHTYQTPKYRRRRRSTRRKGRKLKGGKAKNPDWNWGCYS